jgi:hypothetical protein
MRYQTQPLLNKMTFNDQINTLQKIATANGMYIGEMRNSGSCELHDISGVVDGVALQICVNYTWYQITYRNTKTGDEKTFKF